MTLDRFVRLSRFAAYRLLRAAAVEHRKIDDLEDRIRRVRSQQPRLED